MLLAHGTTDINTFVFGMYRIDHQRFAEVYLGEVIHTFVRQVCPVSATPFDFRQGAVIRGKRYRNVAVKLFLC